MRKLIITSLVFFLTMLFFEDFILYAQSQVDGTQADRTQRRVGIHRGNQVRTVFGNWGVIGQPHGQGPMAAWRSDGDGYVGDISPMVGAEIYVEQKDADGNPVLDDNGNVIIDTVRHVVVTPAFRPGSAVPGEAEEGRAWTFEPVRGFINLDLDEPGKGIAMNHQPETWPPYWPDRPEYVDSLGNVVWNSYFGPGDSKADQESYFWMSDHNDRELLRKYDFRPDSTRLNRGGMGFDVTVRSIQ